MASPFGNFLPKLFAVILGCGLLTLPPFYLLQAERRVPQDEAQRVVQDYLKAAYAHDFKKAYGLISAQDREQKNESMYLREKGPFSGFSLEVARKLANLIEARAIQTSTDGAQQRIRLGLRLPDANSLAPLLLDWDEDRLNALPKTVQRNILDEIDKLRRNRELKMVDGEEDFVLVKEGPSWQVFLDWAAGLRITYSALVPNAGSLEAVPLTKETMVRPSEIFTVTYAVKNRSSKPIATRIVHRIEPQELQQYLDIVECALLLPVKLSAEQEAEFSTTYMVRSDLPDTAKKLNITYEFQIIQ
jgi:hypothetical protein